VSQPADRRATYDDLCRVPDHLVAQIIDGELITLPRPAIGHACASSFLGADLVGFFGRRPGAPGGPGGWWILAEPELHLGPDILVPDLAGWRRERVPALSPETPYLAVSPDWVCEILSPSTIRIDRIRKLAIYARERVGHAWLLDPVARTLEVFRLDGERWLLVGQFEGDGMVRAEPFDAVGLEMGRWWLPEQADGGGTGGGSAR
jgi:Uma2 family endonuclease